MKADLQRCIVLGVVGADRRSLQVQDEERLAGVVEPRASLVVRKMTSGRDIFTGKGRFHVLLQRMLLKFAKRTLMTVTDGVVGTFGTLQTWNTRVPVTTWNILWSLNLTCIASSTWICTPLTPSCAPSRPQSLTC